MAKRQRHLVRDGVRIPENRENNDPVHYKAGKLGISLIIMLGALFACAQPEAGDAAKRRLDQAFVQLADYSSVKYRGYSELSIAGVTIANRLPGDAGSEGRLGSASADGMSPGSDADPFLTAGQLSEVKKTVRSERIDQAAGERIYETDIDAADWKRIVENNWQARLREALEEARAVPSGSFAKADGTRLAEERLNITERAKERLTNVLPSMAAKPTCTVFTDRRSNKLLRMSLVTELTYIEEGRTKIETVTTTYDFSNPGTNGKYR